MQNENNLPETKKVWKEPAIEFIGSNMITGGGPKASFHEHSKRSPNSYIVTQKTPHGTQPASVNKTFYQQYVHS